VIDLFYIAIDSAIHGDLLTSSTSRYSQGSRDIDGSSHNGEIGFRA
jgi:hypothetical protein